MSGKGLGAVLLAVIVLSPLYLTGTADVLVSLTEALANVPRKD